MSYHGHMKTRVLLGSFLLLLTLPACRGEFHASEDTDTDSSDDTGTATETEGDTETETGSETDETGSTGDGDGDGDGDVPSDLPPEPTPEGEPCDPLDADDPCAGEWTCSLYEWDGVGNYFEFVCLEYIGEMDGGGFGDPVGGGGWGECQTGFAPMNNIGLDKFPEGMCPGAGNGGTCCTPICSVLLPNCPAQMECNLFIEPMNPEIYEASQYGTCVRQ